MITRLAVEDVETDNIIMKFPEIVKFLDRGKTATHESKSKENAKPNVLVGTQLLKHLVGLLLTTAFSF